MLVSSHGQKAMIVGDALHTKVQVHEPHWSPGADIDKADSASSRESLLNRAESEHYIVAAGHFLPSENVGRVVRMSGRRYWQPL